MKKMAVVAAISEMTLPVDARNGHALLHTKAQGTVQGGGQGTAVEAVTVD